MAEKEKKMNCRTEDKLETESIGTKKPNKPTQPQRNNQPPKPRSTKGKKCWKRYSAKRT